MVYHDNRPTDIPEYQTYLHRIGRTGRFGRTGVAISFVASKHEWDMLHKIQDHFKCNIVRIDTSDWDAVEDLVKKTLESTRTKAEFAQ